MIYSGLTVLTLDPNRDKEPVQTFNRTKLRIDSGTGPFLELVQGVASRQQRTFEWYMEDRAAIDDFLAFCDARAGRLVPFWVPTWHHDLLLAVNAVDSDASLTIRNVGYANHQFDPNYTWRRHVAFIQIGTGLQFIRRIDGAVDLGDTEQITLDSAVGTALTVGKWMLSFLTMCRLASDAVALHWHTPTMAEASVDVIEIPNEMPVVPV